MLQSQLRGNGLEGVQLGIQPFDAFDRLQRQFARADAASPQ
jgi:hypothetical protein